MASKQATKTAAQVFAKRAGVNRQIDALLKSGARENPAESDMMDRENAAFVREARARIKELDALILQAIDARQWTKADKLDVQRGKLWKQVDILEGRKPRSNNPAGSRQSAPRGKQIFVATRSKNKALQFAESAHGINHGIATKVQGGFVVYQAYDDRASEAKKNPTKRVNKFAPSHQVQTSLDKKTWIPYGDFYAKSKAVETAKSLHADYPNLYVRVLVLP